MGKVVVCTYSRILLSHRQEIRSFIEMWMNPESVTQSEVSQSEKKQISYINTYGPTKLVQMILLAGEG